MPCCPSYPHGATSSVGPPCPTGARAGTEARPRGFWVGVRGRGRHSPGQVHNGLQNVVTQGSAALPKGDPQLLQADGGAQVPWGDGGKARHSLATNSGQPGPAQGSPNPSLWETQPSHLSMATVPSRAPCPPPFTPVSQVKGTTPQPPSDSGRLSPR